MTAAEWRKILDEQDEGDDSDDIEDEFPEDIDDEMDQVFEGQDLESWHPLRVKIIKEKMAPEDDLAQEMTQGLEMKFNKIAPLGKEDTAEELQECSAKTQDTLVDAVKNAEVAEIKISEVEEVFQQGVHLLSQRIAVELDKAFRSHFEKAARS